MPDHAMCSEPGSLPCCENCRRNLGPEAIDQPYQSWQSPVFTESGCDSYWERDE